MTNRSLYLLIPLLTCSSSALAKSRAEKLAAALDQAKTHWTNLRNDKHRARYRSNWMRVAGELQAVSDKAGKAPEASKALLDQAHLYEDMARVSFLGADVDRALELYESAAEKTSEAAVGDEAHLAHARILASRKGSEDQARAELKALVAKRRKGDSVDAARQMLAALPPEPEEDRRSRRGARSTAGTAPRKKIAELSPGTQGSAPNPGSKSEVVAAAPAEGGQVVHEGGSPAAVAARPAAVGPTPIVQRAEVDSTVAEGVEGADLVPAPASAPSAAVSAPHRDAVAAEAAAPPTHPAGSPDRDHLLALAHAVKGAGDVPLSAQMGLKVKRVVIDAGHGGRDTGAVGPDGAKEKDVTVAVAKRLAEKLRGAGLEVVLTRTTDVSVPLEKRAEIANDAHADLFISVHCNASTAASLHGVETYSLNVSSDRYAMRLAARENATSERSISDMRMMLADLTTRADTNDSERLARQVQKSIVGGLRTRYDAVRDLGTKEALFYVLLGARMPAILVETSFISNPTEEKRLTDPQFQDELATSIAAGVDRFVTDRIALASLPTAELP